MQNKYFKALALVIALILIDQFSKYYFLDVIEIATINRNLAFSIRSLSPIVVNLSSFTLFVLVIFIYYRKKVTNLSVMLIAAGAISNIVDRFYRLGVVDFIDLKFWPSFNLADSFIFIGCILLIRELIRD